MTFEVHDLRGLIILALVLTLVACLPNLLTRHVEQGRWFKAFVMFVALCLLIAFSQAFKPDVAQHGSREVAVSRPAPRRTAHPSVTRTPKPAVRTPSPAARTPARTPAPPVRTPAPAVRGLAPPVVRRPNAYPARTDAPQHVAEHRPRPAHVGAAAPAEAARLAALAGSMPIATPQPCQKNARLVKRFPAIAPEIAPVVARTARVTVRVFLDAQGEVTHVMVIVPSGNGAIDRAAIAAAEKSTYDPARSACEAVESHVDVVETFET